MKSKKVKKLDPRQFANDTVEISDENLFRLLSRMQAKINELVNLINKER